MKILVVDNTALFRQVIAQVFSSGGLETVAAESSEAAIAALDQGGFELVCCSYYLSDSTGVELCRRLRALPSGRFLPFILFTSEQSPTVLREAYAAGVTDIFEKQSLDRLLTFIQRLLAQHEPIYGNVLIVEDSPSMANLYRGLLTKFGLQVTVVAQAEEALIHIANHELDMVLTDIVLAGAMTGVTLVNQVRRISGIRGEVPILAITAFDDPARRVELFRLGVNDYVLKPIAAEELAARTRNLIAHFKLLKEVSNAKVAAESDREQANYELAYRATHDELTGLANRWAFEQHLATLLSDAESCHQHGLVLVDMTALRVVNDAGGHEAGDALVREVGRRLRAVMPTTAFAARIEGSRLALILPGRSAGDIGVNMQHIISAIIGDDFLWNDHRYPVTALAGGIGSLHGVESVAQAVSRAETAIAASKSAGSSGLLIYDENDERINAHHRAKHALPELLKALDGEAFALFMQRIAPLSASDAGGYEFLCRMIGRDGQIMLPGAFMPTAESYHLMPRLDRLITRFALDWLAHHNATFAERNFFTINLSGQTLSDTHFAEFVNAELERSGAPPDHIYFEVTETAVLANPEVTLEFMRNMHALGCRFALDDFGSGTATYAQLKNLPVQMLKIDGEFVRGMMTNPVDMAIIRSTCEVARVMNLVTVAEFIESDEEAQILRELGVDYGQGFALGRPQPANENN